MVTVAEVILMPKSAGLSLLRQTLDQEKAELAHTRHALDRG
jgi:hypothetical protein